MDGSRFDAWTRRKFGLVVGGGLAAALGATADVAGKKKRCKKFDTRCNPDSKRKCCTGLACQESASGGNRCCKKLGTKCTDGSECCGNGICDDVEGLSGVRCCFLDNEPCKKDSDCCENRSCEGGVCLSPL